MFQVCLIYGSVAQIGHRENFQESQNYISIFRTTYILILASVIIKCCGWYMVGDLLQSMHVLTLLCGVQIWLVWVALGFRCLVE